MSAPESPAPVSSAPAAFATAHRLRSVRSRFRESQHEQAHDDSQGRIGKVPDHPLICRSKAVFIDTADALEDFLDKARTDATADGSPGLAYDSEFIGESTYYPRLCLIQVATANRIGLIDPLANLDLTPFWTLLGDDTVPKIVHAGEQDLEPALRHSGIAPRNIFDTQVVAGLCGLPYPTSLTKLVEHFLGVRLGKGLTFTRWDQRPLSKKQLAYAADDVRFLPYVAAELVSSLDEVRLEWARSECDRRSSAEFLLDAQEPHERVRGAAGLYGEAMGIIRELALWRDEVAREQDLPPRALVKDEVLVALARRPVGDVGKLLGVRHLPRPVVERFGNGIVEAMARGIANPGPPPPARPPELTLAEKTAGDAAWALLQTMSLSRGIDPNLLASRKDLERLARRHAAGKSLDGHPLMQGWRLEAAGRMLVDLFDGKGNVTIAWKDGGPVIEP